MSSRRNLLTSYENCTASSMLVSVSNFPPDSNTVLHLPHAILYSVLYILNREYTTEAVLGRGARGWAVEGGGGERGGSGALNKLYRSYNFRELWLPELARVTRTARYTDGSVNESFVLR